jgi:hypothetical protein
MLIFLGSDSSLTAPEEDDHENQEKKGANRVNGLSP